MIPFKTYLEQQGMVAKVVKERLKHISVFLNWSTAHKLNPKTLSYLELMHYISYLHTQALGKASINKRLMTLTHYYTHKNWKNIASNVRLRGLKKEQILVFTAEELDQIYESWEDSTKNGYLRHSNKLILGLIIYQGLVSSDIFRLELQDIDLEKGTLYIKGKTHQKRSRTLALERFQILAFYNYMTNHRGKKHPLQKGISPEASQKLFSPNCDKQQRLTEQLKALSKTLKSKHPDFVKLSQLQQSRLTIWITQQGLRKAQYLSGYRSIDKVEQYKTKQTKDLAELIAKYHPLQDKSSKPSST